MFTIDCSNRTRRQFLQTGATTASGLTVFGMPVNGTRAESPRLLRGKSVVVLNLQGGPTQFETFDPKMTAPREIRSITGEVATSIPGVTFGGTIPRLAALAHKMTIVKSYRHGISSHGPAAKHVMAGGNSTGAICQDQWLDQLGHWHAPERTRDGSCNGRPIQRTLLQL